MDWWNNLDSDKEYRKIFCVDGVNAGFCKFYKIDEENKNCVLGADLHKDFRGKGLAKVMWRLMLDLCFQEWKLNRVSLTTAEFNETAIHVYEQLGFMREGRLINSLLRDGIYFDQVCMYMLREQGS